MHSTKKEFQKIVIVSVQPTVITVEKDRTGKTTRVFGAMNEQLQKTKQQMPNLEALATSSPEMVTREKGSGELWVSSVDLKYAHGQRKSAYYLSKRGNFAFLGGRASVIYLLKQHFVCSSFCPKNSTNYAYYFTEPAKCFCFQRSRNIRDKKRKTRTQNPFA